jgi:NAD(P)-dependent dehydrogenase (short-subunit alcohol dehydrogenase family)
MRESGTGRIVNVSSKAAVDIQPGAAAYAVSKAGVVTLTRALREELKGTDITVNAIMPGIIDTPVTRELMPDADRSTWVSPQSVADVLVALCGEGLSAASGSVLRLFGGL